MNNLLKKTITALLIAIMVITTFENHIVYGATKGPKGAKVAQITNEYKAKVTWKKMKNVKKYELYRKYNKKWKKIKTLKKNSYIDRKVKSGKTYRYRVRAVLKNNKKSKYSKTVKIKIKKKTNTNKNTNTDNNKNSNPSSDNNSSGESKDDKDDTYEESENPIYVGYNIENHTAYFSNNVEDLVKYGVDVNDKECYFGDISRDVYDMVGPLYYLDKNGHSVFQINFINEIKPVNTRNWFRELDGVGKFINMDNLNTSNVTDMYGMFLNCGLRTLRSLELGDKCDTSKVKNMRLMFSDCGRYVLNTLNLGDKFDTSNARYMSGMFEACGYMKLEKLDLGELFDTGGCITFSRMFKACGHESLKLLDLGDKFTVSKIQYGGEMFSDLPNIKSINLGMINLEMNEYPGREDWLGLSGINKNLDTCKVYGEWSQKYAIEKLNWNVKNWIIAKEQYLYR